MLPATRPLDNIPLSLNQNKRQHDNLEGESPQNKRFMDISNNRPKKVTSNSSFEIDESLSPSIISNQQNHQNLINANLSAPLSQGKKFNNLNN